MQQSKRDMKILLAEGFKELLLEKSIEKITIKDIADRAGSIRVTFYNHFQDKYELLEWIIQNEILAPVEVLLRNDMTREAVVLIFTNMQRERAFYQKAVLIEGQNSFEVIVEECIRIALLEYINESAGDHQPKFAWLTQESIAQYYAKSMTFVVINWIKSGMKVSPKEMGDIYEYIGQRSLFDMIEELK